MQDISRLAVEISVIGSDLRKRATQFPMDNVRIVCTLKFSITTLHLLVFALLHVPLEDASSGRLVKAGGLEDMGCIDPVVGLASHDMFALSIGTSKLEFPDRILRNGGGRLARAKG